MRNVCTQRTAQAGTAWPRLKPFVLDLLTTLIGKQVRACLVSSPERCLYEACAVAVVSSSSSALAI